MLAASAKRLLATTGRRIPAVRACANMGTLVERPEFKPHYDNYIGGEFVPPVEGNYFDNVSPVDGLPFTKAAASTAADIELALDAAHAAAPAFGKTSATERSIMLNKIADRIEENLEVGWAGSCCIYFCFLFFALSLFFLLIFGDVEMSSGMTQGKGMC